jgi:alpha-tubulin suppressor-like RCC1 family protein
MPRYGSMACRIGMVLAVAAALVVPLMFVPTASASLGTSSASAVDNPPWTHAVSWGANFWGEVGNGSRVVRIVRPVSVNDVIKGFRQVSAGSVHSLAVAADDTVYGWGENEYGQLGFDPHAPGSGIHSASPVPVPVAGLSEVTRVAGGYQHSLALRSDGTVWAWGDNQYGQLGDGTRFDRHVPAPVHGISGVVAIAAGSHHNLALRSDGTVWAWGANYTGQLGDGIPINHLMPVVVPGLRDVVAIDAGAIHSIALRSFAHPVLNEVLAWGDNGSGQLGDGTQVDRDRPTRVWAAGGVTAIAAGANHSLAATYTGRVLAWGSNFDGRLGDGTQDRRLTPVSVVGLTGVSAVTAGDFFSAALRGDGTVWTWGDNQLGQLGDGTQGRRLTPVRVPGLGGVTEISAGSSHVVAALPVTAPRFTVSVPAVGRIPVEGSLRVGVGIGSVNLSTHVVALSVSGLPAGVSAVFDPPTVVAGGSSALVLSGTEVAEVGPALLTVTATATPATLYPTTVSATLALTVIPGGCAVTVDTDVAIPDGGPAAMGVMVLPVCEDPPDLNSSIVEVHIVHPRRGDLAVDLIDPHGRSIRLKSSDPADTGVNVDARFQIQLDSDLEDRLDDGPWRLRVEDVATGAVGHLDSWTLYL